MSDGMMDQLRDAQQTVPELRRIAAMLRQHADACGMAFLYPADARRAAEVCEAWANTTERLWKLEKRKIMTVAPKDPAHG